MELKEMILSTLAELDEGIKQEGLQPPIPKEEPTAPLVPQERASEMPEEAPLQGTDREKAFYLNVRERILVLFEGFQSPNNKNIEAKIDLTLNFLEYLLATIDEQLERMDKGR